MSEIILDILKRKITIGEITVDDIKNATYKAAIVEWQSNAN